MTIQELIDQTSNLLDATNREANLPCDLPTRCAEITRGPKFHYGWPLNKDAGRLCPACRANFLISVAWNAMIELASRR